MATTITYATIVIPQQDANGVDTSTGAFAFAKQIAALTVDNRSYLLSGNVFDQNGNFVGSNFQFQFFINPVNNATALADFTTYKNSLPTGTNVNVFYNTFTLGV